MVGVEIKAPAFGDFSRVRGVARAIQWLALEGRGRDELRRRLTGIERYAAWVATDVDDRARELCPHQRRAERRDKVVELIEPPIRVLAREPRINESRFEPEELCSRVRNADDERRIAALDDKPVGMCGGHRGSPSSEGRVAAPTASMTALRLARFVAAAMSGWK